MKDKIKKMYLSGPISGYDIAERKETFKRKQRELESYGYEILNPMENGLPVDAVTHAHMRRDFEMLLQCDAIYFMEKWLHSKGCAVEFDVATACGMEVYFEEAFSIDYGHPIKFK